MRLRLPKLFRLSSVKLSYEEPPPKKAAAGTDDLLGQTSNCNGTMKTTIRKLLGLRVHELWFVLACLLLGAVVLAATVMVEDLGSMADKQLERNGIPLHVSPQT
jgi:hypothetical protein